MRKKKGSTMKKIIFFILAGLIGFAVGNGVLNAENPPSNYYVDEAKLPFEALSGTDTARYWGVHNGAGYRVEVPANWNGELVLYCHGYMGYGPELIVTNPSIRKYLIDNGYAWAASSYRTNGIDVKLGVLDTHALAEFFNGLVGNPKRTYLIGHSMGGYITSVAIEQYPKGFDGALPMCGVLGDSEILDYFLDYHVVAQWLTETRVDFPYPEDYATVIIPEMKNKLGGVAPGFPFTLSSDGVKLMTATKYLSGGERPLSDIGFKRGWGGYLFTWGLDGTFGGILPGNGMDNRDSVYQLDDDPAISPEEDQLNSEALRVSPTRRGKHPMGLANLPKITGNISIPVLTLHTIGDLFVPILMEQIYARRVADEGKSSLLVQRVIRSAGHCDFGIGEEEQAFADLVDWVVQGVKPAGDDVLTPTVVADPKYGCQFTLVRRPYDPAPWVCDTP